MKSDTRTGNKHHYSTAASLVCIQLLHCSLFNPSLPPSLSFSFASSTSHPLSHPHYHPYLIPLPPSSSIFLSLPRLLSHSHPFSLTLSPCSVHFLSSSLSSSSSPFLSHSPFIFFFPCPSFSSSLISTSPSPLHLPLTSYRHTSY